MADSSLLTGLFHSISLLLPRMDTNSLLLLGIIVAVGVSLYLRFGATGSDSKKNDDVAKSQSWRGSGAQNIDPILRNRHGIQNGEVKEWTLEEVKNHNQPDDLFMVVQNKVYDLTDFVADHPGGDSILKLPGLDNTEGFSGIQHPAKVWDMIQDYYVGEVKKAEHVVYTFKNVSKL